MDDFREVKERIYNMQSTIEELDDVVRGDEGRNMKGLVRDMEYVRIFIEKWERREYMIRGMFLLLGSNLVLTILAIAANIFIGT